MDIRIRFTKKVACITTGIIVCGLISLGCWNTSAFKARRDIKATCQDNCGCFNNVVDYRLTNEQVRLFAQFMKELQVRKSTSVLEFMDTVEAIRIQKAFAICQPQPESTPAPNTPEQPAQVKRKKK